MLMLQTMPLRWLAAFSATVRFSLARAVTLVGGMAAVAGAQPGPSAAVTSAKIPVRQLTNTARSDSTILMGIASVRPLANGGVLVNDATRRQLVVFDSTLTRHTIIADTSTNSPNSYGLRGSAGGLIPYVADSSIFVDSESRAFLVIDQLGLFARVMAPVKANDLFYLSSGAYGLAATDPKGRMLYRTVRSQRESFDGYQATSKTTLRVQPDSGPILRADFDKRTVDTIGMIRVPLLKYAIVTGPNFQMNFNVLNPLPVSDEWTMLPDGTIAIVRAQDYHMDWLTPDGKLSSSPKMPFDWKRLEVEDKQKLIDSVKKELADRAAKLPPPPPPTPGMPTFPRDPGMTIEANELPDYYPAIRQGQVRADPLGNVWILPSTSAAAKGGLLYDVVNRQGEITERVQLPPGRTLVGFGKDGSVYMHHVQSPKHGAIERATVLR